MPGDFLLVLVVGAAGLVAVFLLRTVYIVLTPGAIDRDAFAHMLYAEDIREHGHRLPERPDQVVTSGEYAYPFFLHWVLSFVPPRYYPQIDRYFSPVMDVLVSLLILGLVPMGFASVGEAVAMVWIFAVTPQFMRPDLPSAIGLSGRKPGLIVTTIGILSFVIWSTADSLLALGMAVLFGALVFLTSKFSIQAFIVVCLAFGVGVNPAAFLLAPAAFVAAVTLSGGRYLPVFRGYLTFLHEYATVKQYKLFEPIRWNPLAILRDVSSTEELLRAAYNNRIVRPTANNPYFVAVLVTYGWAGQTGASLDFPWIFHVWIVGCLWAFVLTSLPHFMFLGKAERYLDYALLPATLLLVRGWQRFGTTYRVLVATLLLGGLGIIAIYVWSYRSMFFSTSHEDAWEELIEELRARDPGVVLVQPWWGGRRLAWYTDHKVVDCILNEGPADNEEMDTLFPERYGIVTPDVGWLAEQYDPDWVVFDKRTLDDAEGIGLLPPASSPLFENDHFSLYDFDAVGASEKGT